MRSDDPDTFDLVGPPALPCDAQSVIDALTPVVTAARLQRIEEVVAGRTLDVVAVLDQIIDPHNASAVLRSADAFGVQRVCAVEGEAGFRAAKTVAKGSHRWLDIQRFQTAKACANNLHADGYKIYVASMHATTSLESLCDEDRIAVVFGNEHRGPSEEMRAHSDGTFAIPMRGFVESLNVSVAAALTIYSLTSKNRKPLKNQQKMELMARYLMNSVRDAEQIIAEYTPRAS